MHEIFFTAPQHIQNLHFAKKMVKNDQPSPQQWSEENTAANMGHHQQQDDQDKEPKIDRKII